MLPLLQGFSIGLNKPYFVQISPNRSKLQLSTKKFKEKCARLLPVTVCFICYRWAADLGAEYHVQRVEVTNRQDCCMQRASNLRVGVTNTRPVPGQGFIMDRDTLCGWKRGAMGAIGVIYCPDYISGRFVVVQFETVNVMNICEVDIFGYK